jgi:hypothetical protein
MSPGRAGTVGARIRALSGQEALQLGADGEPVAGTGTKRRFRSIGGSDDAVSVSAPRRVRGSDSGGRMPRTSSDGDFAAYHSAAAAAAVSASSDSISDPAAHNVSGAPGQASNDAAGYTSKSNSSIVSAPTATAAGKGTMAPPRPRARVRPAAAAASGPAGASHSTERVCALAIAQRLPPTDPLHAVALSKLLALFAVLGAGTTGAAAAESAAKWADDAISAARRDFCAWGDRDNFFFFFFFIIFYFILFIIFFFFSLRFSFFWIFFKFLFPDTVLISRKYYSRYTDNPVCQARATAVGGAFVVYGYVYKWNIVNQPSLTFFLLFFFFFFCGFVSPFYGGSVL